MGGTQFNGLALVHELVRAGHDVAIFNRGRTEAELPRGVERLVGDRTEPDSVRKAIGGRDWDAVFDISAYRPEDVGEMVEILDGRTGHYVFASSTVIYAATDRLPICEGHPVERGPAQNAYGLNKLLCEDVLLRAHLENRFPATIAAFSMVFGPNNIIPDREQRMFVRLLQGRRVLIPGRGTTVGQIGHVHDEARALRMMMQKPATFGRRYNLTGDDCFTDHGYVDTLADVMGIDPERVEKVSIPADVMDEIYAGRISLSGEPVAVRADTRSGQDARAVALFQINRIIQRIAPNVHHWDRNVFFSVDRLKEDTGWRPEYTFRGAVEQTWEWMRSTGRHESLSFDFEFEDRLIERIEAR